MFGPTKCGEILTEKYMNLSSRNRKKIMPFFMDYMSVAKEVEMMYDGPARNLVITALRLQAKQTIYSDIKMHNMSEEDTADIKQRIYFCIKFRLNQL